MPSGSYIATEFLRSEQEHLDFALYIDTLWYHDRRIARKNARIFLRYFYPDVIFRGDQFRNRPAKKQYQALLAKREGTSLSIAEMMEAAGFCIELFEFSRAREWLNRAANLGANQDPQWEELSRQLTKAESFPVFNPKMIKYPHGCEAAFVLLDRFLMGEKGLLQGKMDRKFARDLVLKMGLSAAGNWWHHWPAMLNPLNILTTDRRHPHHHRPSVFGSFRETYPTRQGKHTSLNFRLWYAGFAEGIFVLSRQFMNHAPSVPEGGEILSHLRKVTQLTSVSDAGEAFRKQFS